MVDYGHSGPSLGTECNGRAWAHSTTALQYPSLLVDVVVHDQPGDPRLSKLSFRVQSHTFVAVDADTLIGFSGLVVPAVSFQNIHLELYIITTIMFIGNVLP